MNRPAENGTEAAGRASDDVVFCLGDPNAIDVRHLLDSCEAHSRSLYPDEGVHMLDVSMLQGERVRFYVARLKNGNAAATGAIVLLDDGDAEIKRMYVAENARRQGIGTRMLRHLESVASAAGVTRLLLETGPLQTAAIDLYLRNGYKRRGRFGPYVESPWSVFMEKNLRAGETHLPLNSTFERG